MRKHTPDSTYGHRQDIAVSSAVENEVGSQHIMASVKNSRQEGDNTVADCDYEGTLYKARYDTFLGLSYWLLIEKQ